VWVILPDQGYTYTIFTFATLKKPWELMREVRGDELGSGVAGRGSGGVPKKIPAQNNYYYITYMCSAGHVVLHLAPYSTHKPDS